MVQHPKALIQFERWTAGLAPCLHSSSDVLDLSLPQVLEPVTQVVFPEVEECLASVNHHPLVTSCPPVMQQPDLVTFFVFFPFST